MAVRRASASRAIVVTNYLHRPLFPRARRQSLDEGGVLIYETFMVGQRALRQTFQSATSCCGPGELLQAFGGAAVVAFEQGRVERPKRR